MMNLGWPNFDPPDDDSEPQPPKIDERWLCEYAEYGTAAFIAYLKNHALFAAWLENHPTKGET